MTFIDCGQRPSQATDTQGLSPRHLAVALTLLGAGVSLTAVGLGKLSGRVGFPVAGALGITACVIGLWPADSAAPQTPKTDDTSPEEVTITSLKIDPTLSAEEILKELDKCPELKELDLREWTEVPSQELIERLSAEGPLEVIHWAKAPIEDDLEQRIRADQEITEEERRFLGRLADMNPTWLDKFGEDQAKLLALMPELQRVDLTDANLWRAGELIATFEALHLIGRPLEIEYSDRLADIREHIASTPPDDLGEGTKAYLNSIEHFDWLDWKSNKEADAITLLKACPNVRTADFTRLDKAKWTDELANEVDALALLGSLELGRKVYEEIATRLNNGDDLEPRDIVALRYAPKFNEEMTSAKAVETLLKHALRIKALSYEGNNVTNDLLQHVQARPDLRVDWDRAQSALKKSDDGTAVEFALLGLAKFSLGVEEKHVDRLAGHLPNAKNLSRVIFSPGNQLAHLEKLAEPLKGKALQIRLTADKLTTADVETLLTQLQPASISLVDRAYYGTAKCPTADTLDQLERDYHLWAKDWNTPPRPFAESDSEALKALTWATIKADPTLLHKGVDGRHLVLMRKA